MRPNRASGRGLVSVCATLVMLAGCGGSQGQTNSLVPSQSGASSDALAHAAPPSPKLQDLLYVSDAKTGAVEIYSYPERKPVGHLAVQRAAGLCSDDKGDVFVPQGNEILEYPHAGMHSIAILRDPLGIGVQFCAVDPATGSLAVSGGASGGSRIALYAGAAGNPKLVETARAGSVQSLTYDNNGDLLIVAAGRRGDAPKLLELAKGAAHFVEVEWPAGAPRLGAIQWDGNYLAVIARAGGSTALFRYAIAANRAALAGRAPLQTAVLPVQFAIYDGKVVLPADFTKDGLAPMGVTISKASAPPFAVTTFHYDTLRTGWNDDESTLSYANVTPGSFGLLHAVPLDDQVDAQPLVVPGETTTRGKAPGIHDVVYVATENDTVYAIDASSGTVLFSQSLGTPVPSPLGCNNNAATVGINGTPVIDLANNVMYVIAYTMLSGTPAYFIHELNLSNLSDVIPPVAVAASHVLTDGTSFSFNATYQRQRAALLEANGNIYAGFGSFCDYGASMSRGWLLGWQAGSLVPLPANELVDSLDVVPHNFYLSSVWMSGNGPAVDSSGNIYFVTGNSDPYGKTYNGATNIQESVVKVSSDLTQVLSLFTPSDYWKLDKGDLDFGSGGVLLLPTTTSTPLAAVAGKTGTLFLLNQNNLGGYTPGGPNNDVDSKPVGGCWCGESYFAAAKDGLPRIVASGGNNVTVWKLKNSPALKLAAAGVSPQLPGAQDPGFFTSVSSNGTNPNAIVWAVARPQEAPPILTLYAFKSQPASGTTTLPTLYQAPAGSWESANADANVVPVVANGNVYVASYQELYIFGTGGSFIHAPPAPAARPSRLARGLHEVTGALVAMSGRSLLTLRTRTGNTARVDDSAAVRHERSSDLVAGEPFSALGTYDAAGVLHAKLIIRVKRSQVMWPPDR
jgi:hypothetical protein